jgi:V/A-type H+-transporting ATPase subunit C
MKSYADAGLWCRDDSAYAAPCGLVRVLEKQLLGAARIEELLAASDLAALLRMLVRYGALSGASETLERDWARALELSLLGSDRTLLAIDPRPAVSEILVARADLVNLRSLLRSRALGVPFDGAWHPRGRFGRTALEESVRFGDWASWPPPLARALEAMGDIGPSTTLPALNDALDAAWFGALLGAARASGSRFFVDWLGHAADLANIRARLRVAAAPRAWPALPAPLPGGHLDAERFSADATLDKLLAEIGRTVYAPLTERARAGEGEVSLAAFERAADDFLMRLLEPARFVSLGPEPLWAWHLAREMDAKNVRAIVFGALAGIDPERRRSLLRQPYGA